MTDKDKRQLRAEAVERLRKLEGKAASYEQYCKTMVDSPSGMLGQVAVTELIELLTDDEPTNVIDGETNAIAPDIPLDEPPEGDAVAILRRVASDKTNVSSDDLLRYAVGADMVPDALNMLADMVERDYVWGEDYNDLALLRAQAERERDEWKAKAENRVRGIPEQYRALYDNLAHAHPWMREMRDAMGAGSSKVRAGSSNGAERSNDGVKRSMTELEWLYESDEFFSNFARWYVTDGECADDDLQADEWLMSEHVEEPCAESYMDADEGEQNPRSREADSDGRVSSEEPKVTCPDSGHSRTMSGNAPECVRNDGETSENDVSAVTLEANDAEAFLGTEVSSQVGSEVREHSLTSESVRESDEKSRETPDFAENPQKSSFHGQNSTQNDAREKLEANAAAANQPNSPSVAPKPPETAESDARKGDMRDFDADTREKLEADIEKYFSLWLGVITNETRAFMRVIRDWLDRQAAITKHEVGHKLEQAESVCMGQRAEIEKLTAERDALARDLAECEREREKWRAACGRMLDAAHEIEQMGGAR